MTTWKRMFFGGGLGVCLLLGVLTSIGTLRAAPLPQAPILRPEDITTPTPVAVLLPTPTPVAEASAPSLPAEDPVEAARRSGGGVYVVQPDDTLWTVALEVGVDLEEAPCLVGPMFRPEQPLVIGDPLDVLPLGWQCHRVQAGETLAMVAARYGVEAQRIRAVAWNELAEGAHDDAPLPLDRYVRIPGETEPLPGGFMTFMLDQPVSVSPYVAYAVGGPRAVVEADGIPTGWPYGSGHFTWPVYGWMSQGYRDDHRAVDIAAPLGTVVTASDRGVVIRAGWNDQGYGNFVIIDHNIDYVTLYSHLADIFVQEGEVVAQGQRIGTVGSTGNSTGAHLHFEIRDFGRRANPVELLMR